MFDPSAVYAAAARVGREVAGARATRRYVANEHVLLALSFSWLCRYSVRRGICRLCFGKQNETKNRARSSSPGVNRRFVDHALPNASPAVSTRAKCIVVAGVRTAFVACKNPRSTRKQKANGGARQSIFASASPGSHSQDGLAHLSR